MITLKTLLDGHEARMRRQVDFHTRRRVPVHVVRGHQTHNIEPDLKAGDVRIPTLNEVWTFAPRRDFSKAPDQNREWYDRGPAVRIGYSDENR